ncbi:MAG: hypothetical protein WA610_09165 [Thermodesulfovibrionales bacterium]
MQQIITRIRFYHYITGVLVNQQNDPLCSICKAATSTAARMKEGIRQLEKDCAADRDRIPASIGTMLAETLSRLTAINFPEEAAGQKKAGNCKLPEGVCFVKNSKALQDRI